MRFRRLSLIVPALLLTAIPGKIFLVPAWNDYVRARRDKAAVAVHDAVVRGDPTVLKAALDGGLDPNAKDNKTPLLIVAAQNGHADIIKLLRDKGANVNARDATGTTALMQAAVTGSVPSIRLLLDAGADIDAKDKTGQTAFVMADASQHPEGAKLIIDKGSEVKAAGGATWLLAARTGDASLMRKLREQHVSIDARNSAGSTALHSAVDANIATMRTLLKWGANPNIKDDLGMTPLTFASQRGFIDKVKLLIDHHADVNIRMKDGECALTYAWLYRRLPIVTMLVKAGAKEEYLDQWKRGNR